MKKGFLFLIIIFILISCGNEPPSISFPMYHILVYQQGSLNNQLNDTIYLSFYFLIFDENGEEDINELKITHIETEYSWNIRAEDLSKVEYNDKTFMGYSFIEYDSGKKILLGDYHIEVIDKVENHSDLMVTVEIEGETDRSDYPIPAIRYNATIVKEEKELSIEGDEYSSVEIMFLNKPTFFNGGRKKFSRDEKIILNNNKPVEPGSNISVRVNKGINENLIFFLKPVISENKE